MTFIIFVIWKKKFSRATLLLMCDIELPGSNPAVGTLKFSGSVPHSLKINGEIAPYCKPRPTPLTTHVITFHSLLSPDLPVS